jgi:hypothetical protein
VQAGLELAVLLPQPPGCWDYRHTLPHLATGSVLLLEHFTRQPVGVGPLFVTCGNGPEPLSHPKVLSTVLLLHS